MRTGRLAKDFGLNSFTAKKFSAAVERYLKKGKVKVS